MDFIIRPIKSDDGADINEIRLQIGVMLNTLSIPTESIGTVEDFIENADGILNHILVAQIALSTGEDKIIGYGGFHIMSNPRLRHSASLGISVHENFHGKSVGTKLMEKLLDTADNWLMLSRMELTVFTDNVQAVKFYERFGFEKEGIKRKAAIRNGSLCDEYMMARIRRFS